MHHEMSSGTDAGRHVLYDPSSPPPKSLRATDEALEAAQAAGELLVIDPAADGEIGYRIYVDAPLPEELRPRAQQVSADLLLRAPSGQLVACGLEYLWSEDQKESAAQVPAGDYLVDAWTIDVDWDEEIVPVLMREVGAGYRREVTVGPLGGFLILAGIVALLISLFKWWLPGVLGGVVTSALGAATLALGMPRGEYWTKKDEIARRFPSLILILRRVDDAAGRAGGTIQLA
jgi:hypothetical protein